MLSRVTGIIMFERLDITRAELVKLFRQGIGGLLIEISFDSRTTESRVILVDTVLRVVVA